MALPKSLVWITGASSGIGWATALHLARRGYEVAASARNHDALLALKSKHRNIHPFPLDVADPIHRELVYLRLRRELGPVDMLINNAGRGLRGAIEDVPAYMLRDLFDTNVFAPIALARLVLPEMRARREGRIINVSSVVGRFTPPLGGVYSATKHALEAISDALRIELLPWSVKVILIEPGPIRTDFGRRAKRQSAEILFDETSPYYAFYRRFLEHPPLGNSNSWGPASVAEVIRKAIDSPAPHARYRVHPAALLLPFLQAHLPRPLADRLLGRVYGIQPENRR